MDNNNAQQQGGYRRPPMPPKSWLLESILVTLFCCLPFGIVGIIYAAKVESLFYAGYVEEAELASRDAGKWTKIGFWVGLALTVAVGAMYAGGLLGILSGKLPGFGV